MKHFKARDTAYIGLSAALISICSWITVPVGAVPVTLQTMAVCLISALLGMKRGVISVFIYILAGAIGVPVFSSFRGGIGVLLGATGGYIIGFLFTSLTVGLISEKAEGKLWITALSMVLGTVICYAVGTLWFAAVYTKSGKDSGVGAILSACVIPFIIPDLIKIALAAFLTQRLKKYIKD